MAKEKLKSKPKSKSKEKLKTEPKSNYILSICLITKNEEKNLKKCLDSLSPLMNALPCELIITDTGSTDNTVEVAKEYTENVGHFEWIDDFSAARNHGLKQAKGEWLMWLDADMWFEDVDKIVDFFQSYKYKKAGCASVICRNLMDGDDKFNYLDGKSILFHKIFPKTTFVNKIHEAILATSPIYKIDEVCYHSGYDNRIDPKLRKEKYERNTVPLLEEYKEDAENLRTILQLIDIYKSNGKMMECREYIENGYSIIKNDPSSKYYAIIMKHLCTLRQVEKNYREVLNYAIEFLENREKPTITDLDFYYFLAENNRFNNEFRESIKWYEKFLENFDDYKKSILSKEISDVDIAFCSTDKVLQNVKFSLANCYNSLNDGKKKAVELIESIDIKYISPRDISEIMKYPLEKGKKDGDYSSLYNIYKNIQIAEMQQDVYLKYFTYALEDFLVKNPDALQNIAKVFVDGDNSFDYIILQELRFYDSLQNGAKAEEKLTELVNNIKTLDLATSDLIYYILKYGHDLEGILQRIEERYSLPTICSDIIEKHRDTPLIIKEYLQKRNKNSKPLKASEHLIIITLLEHVLLKSKKYDIKENIENFEIATYEIYSFANHIYSEEVLKEESINILPTIYAFSYYAYKALIVGKSGDKLNYIQYLKHGLNIHPQMKDLIKVLLENIETSIDNKKNPEEIIEFSKYAKEVKGKIIGLIEMGLVEEVRPLIEVYEKVNPNDKDIIEMKKKAKMIN